MANKQQVTLLKKGYKAWNEWRSSKLGVDIDLYGADFTGPDFNGVNLQGANFKGADLRGAILRGIDFQKVNLTGANLRGAQLQRANLSGGFLNNAKLQDANLSEAILIDSDLKGAVFDKTVFKNANLQGANLHDADLVGADLGHVNLQNADLGLANLIRANLQNANLQGADLKKSNLRAANIIGALIERADLRGAILEDTQISNPQKDYLRKLEIISNSPGDSKNDNVQKKNSHAPDSGVPHPQTSGKPKKNSDEALHSDYAHALSNHAQNIGSLNEQGKKTQLEINALRKELTETISALGSIEELRKSQKNSKSAAELNETLLPRVKKLEDEIRSSLESIQQISLIRETIELSGKNAEEAVSRAEAAIEQANEAITTTGITRQAKFFKVLANKYADQSKAWLWCTGILAVLMLAEGFGLIDLVLVKLTLIQPKPDIPSDWTGQQRFWALVTWVSPKMLRFSLYYTALVFFIKAFNASKHNLVVNEHRRIALSTFQSFARGPSEQSIKDAILLETSRSIFAHQASGFEKFGIEGPKVSHFTDIVKKNAENAIDPKNS